MLDRYRDVFESLNAHDVRYLVIGGIAAIVHGLPRMTFDLDILIEVTPDNAQRLLDAFLEARLGTAALITADDLLAMEVTVFRDRVRIDVQTATPGITFAEAWPRRDTIEHRGIKIPMACKADTIASKLAAGRTVDLEDARLLSLAEEEEPDANPA